MFEKLISTLMASRDQAHIFHWQTTGAGSFAAHTALNAYYDAIPDLTDTLVESYQGKHGLLKNYKTFDMVDYKSNDQLLKYFKELLEIISDNRDSVKESYLQNQIDTIEELINSTLYKLKFLK